MEKTKMSETLNQPKANNEEVVTEWDSLTEMSADSVDTTKETNTQFDQTQEAQEAQTPDSATFEENTVTSEDTFNLPTPDGGESAPVNPPANPEASEPEDSGDYTEPELPEFDPTDTPL